MSWGYGGYPPYVSADEKRRRRAREVAALEKQGRTLAPVAIEGRAIARTFWGKAWCENLERYSDLASRLPRGRTYVRNGSVLDLQIKAGAARALVSGSDIYTVEVTVTAVPKPRWSSICTDCAGAIDSLVELLQGRLSNSVMERICRADTGLFPAPKEIDFDCSCPDSAYMCKHVAAVLYGIGARLDDEPRLLFALRKVDEKHLIAKAGQGAPLARSRSGKGNAPKAGRILASDDLGALFGLELASFDSPAPRARSGRTGAAPASGQAGRATASRGPARRGRGPG
jgi:uncharacterized Zn finger protein